MLHTSYLELSKSALQNNIQFLKQQIAPQVQLSSVIKGNAYGHGIEQFAPLAQECGINHFSVFSTDEAHRLLQALPQRATIMILGFIDEAAMEWVVANEIEFFVFDVERLAEAIEAAKKTGKKAKVHLELETGMNRSGFDRTNLVHAQAMLRNNKEHLLLQGVCTHLAGAESLQNHERVLRQQEIFAKALQRLRGQGHAPNQRHVACSAAMISYPESHLDMVRVGIMQYGLWPSPETYRQFIGQHEDKVDPLQRVISWKSRVMGLKHVPQGEYIGYGTSFQAPRDMNLALIPVGYSCGYSRSLSNQGQVLVRGHRASVVGIVNMNMMMVDVTNIPEAGRGDEVILLGKQGDEVITVASFGELSTQLNYELLTRLPLTIPRYVVE
ncbi:alanine racemase [Pontibacter ummariensis]|uniref:Alanine racemase n=1 Tax=Pontibacter ummariensis TaxID=1610492 RepID=A0A239FKS8_9BACT|nr:alanine racemase [Pontibacter ummariensis]PRY12034.1 alanine racemase [Pontibacter ummariensis]SNS57357.1 alanine racemase [Pontibacter ummariensis]